jgi:cytochrome c biogenesis protein CcmG/thiol:disulfide interchange protein DsbE
MSTRTRIIAKQRKREQQRKLLYGIVACVVILAAILAVVVQRNDGSSAGNTSQTQPVTITGAALPAYDANGRDPAVGTTIPTLAGTSLVDGTPVRVANDGKPKVLLFVAHWCPHCQREVPLLAGDLHKTPLPAGVEMITISTGVDPAAPNYPPSQWLAGVQWPTPVIADDANSSAAQAFGLSAYPYFVFVDANNKVVARSSGEMPLTEFRSHVAALQAT